MSNLMNVEFISDCLHKGWKHFVEFLFVFSKLNIFFLFLYCRDCFWFLLTSLIHAESLLYDNNNNNNNLINLWFFYSFCACTEPKYTYVCIHACITMFRVLCLLSCLCLCSQALICPTLWMYMCAQNACNTVEYCVYMRQRDPTKAVGLNIMFDSVLINACFISSWSWTSFQTTGDPLSNCCEALRQIRLVSPPSMCTFFFFPDYHSKSVVTNFSMWNLFSLPIIRSDFLFKM